MAEKKLASREELLEKLGLSDDELRDLLDKFRDKFLYNLNRNQLKVVKRTLPSLCEAQAWLGTCASVDDLRELFGGGRGEDSPPVMVCHFATTERPGN
jgi:hypothetical protein